MDLSASGFIIRKIPKVTPGGLEPTTLSLKVRCSNQLSYGISLNETGGKRGSAVLRFLFSRQYDRPSAALHFLDIATIVAISRERGVLPFSLFVIRIGIIGK